MSSSENSASVKAPSMIDMLRRHSALSFARSPRIRDGREGVLSAGCAAVIIPTTSSARRRQISHSQIDLAILPAPGGEPRPDLFSIVSARTDAATLLIPGRLFATSCHFRESEDPELGIYLAE